MTTTKPSSTGRGTVRKGALLRNWHLVPRAFRYVRPYRRDAIASVVLTILLAVMAVAQPWPLAFVVDTVLHDRPAPGWLRTLFGDGDRALIIVGAGGILLVALLTGALTLAHEYVTTSLDQRMVLDLRSELYRHVLRLPPTYHEDRPTGRLMYVINDEPASLGHVVLTFPDLLQSALTLLGMLVVAFRIDPSLTLLSLGVTPFVAWSTTHFANRIEAYTSRARRLEMMTISIVHEALTMVRVIFTFGREAREHHRFRARGQEAVEARVRLTLREATFKLVVNFITAVGTAAVLWYAARQVMRGRLSVGELLVVLSYVAAVYAPLRALTTKLSSLQQTLLALRSMFGLLDTAPDVREKPGAVTIERARGQVTLEDVAFAYSSRDETLRSISFTIEPGEAVAVVGPTGAGKSTLVSLLPRHLEARAGRISIDGIDVRDLTLASLRAQFSFVLQEPLLFSGTVRENIAYGRLDASAGEIEQAARDANAHDFICRLPDGYDTTIGERGTRLSGGERQRISVARAFVRDAPILILDEPTSSIDSRTEAVILDALERLMQGRTTIMIAHRLSTIRAVDRILVLDEGRLVEQGTHDELVARDGLYHELWHAQAAQRERVDAARHAIGQPAPPPLQPQGSLTLAQERIT